MKQISGMPDLDTLSLSKTKITDAGLADLEEVALYAPKRSCFTFFVTIFFQTGMPERCGNERRGESIFISEY